MSLHSTQAPDPYSQTFTWTDTSGIPITITMPDLSAFTSQNISLGLIYGSQIGLAALMLLTLLLLTHPSKRRSPIFALNTLALTLDLLRGVMMAVWLGSIWNNVFVYFSNDSSRITNTDIANSVAAPVLKLLELATVQTSLIFQVRVILTTATELQRLFVVCVSVVVALVTVGTQFASVVVNAENIASLAGLPGQLSLQQRLADYAAITELTSVCFFLVIFASKLGVAIRQRYKLGQSKFGPMQIVFIGSLQSMVLPMIFTAAQYNRKVDLGSMSMTVLVIQLPLTALWASTSLEDRCNLAPKPGPQQPLIAVGNDQQRGASTFGSGKSLIDKEVGMVSSSSEGSEVHNDHDVEGSREYALAELPTVSPFEVRNFESMDVDVKMNEKNMR